jgi:mRNA interferase MazF
MEKDFNSWNKLKQDLDKSHKSPTFKQREIWWCHLGLNIGHEENGKGDLYKRPVLIVKKFNNRLFWGLPLTTQIKDKNYYHKINFKNKEQCLMLSQFKVLESRRLTTIMGTIGKNQFSDIKKVLINIMMR